MLTESWANVRLNRLRHGMIKNRFLLQFTSHTLIFFAPAGYQLNIIKSFDPFSSFSRNKSRISFTRPALSFADSRDCKACENHYRICWEFQCRICHQPNDPWKFQLRFSSLSFFLLLLLYECGHVISNQL